MKPCFFVSAFGVNLSVTVRNTETVVGDIQVNPVLRCCSVLCVVFLVNKIPHRSKCGDTKLCGVESL